MDEKVKINIYENFVHIFEKKQANFSGAALAKLELDVPLAAELESLTISSDKKLEIVEIAKTNPNFEEELKKNIGKKITYGKDSGVLVEIQPNISMTLKTKKGYLLVPISYSYITLSSLPKLTAQVIASCEAEKGSHNLSISYLASGFSSSATFILTLKKEAAELQGYFIIANSIKDFEKAQITIISGKVNKISYGYYPNQNQYALQNNVQNYNAPVGLGEAMNLTNLCSMRTLTKKQLKNIGLFPFQIG